MDEIQKLKEWWFSIDIEKINEKEVRERTRTMIDVELPNKILNFPYVGTRQIGEYSTFQLIATCPITACPDFYEIVIRYVPNKYLPELKSLRLYFIQYANFPISHEHFIEKIYNDFVKVVEPENIYIKLSFNTNPSIYSNVAMSAIIEKGDNTL